MSIRSLQHKPITEFSSGNILPQTPYWGFLKENQGFDPCGIEYQARNDLLNPQESSDQKSEEELLILFRHLDQDHCYAYVPYGPKMEPIAENHGVFLEELSESLRPQLPDNCAFIRYDLMWENQWADDSDFYDEQGNWLGPPERKAQEFRLNINTDNWNLRKSAGDVLPKNTFFLDLQKDEDQLLANMRKKTRYSVRQALNRGVRVREYGRDHLDQWYKLYHETATRHGMGLQSKEYFAQVLDAEEKAQKNVVQPTRVKMLMADYQGEFLASMFLVLNGKRATYLYGASSTTHKNLLAPYALQWESIKLARSLGYEEYDMFGSAPNLDPQHPLHGVHVYKKGFGGNLYHRMGCWDYVLDDSIYSIYSVLENR